ncbi:rod-binding protein [Emcibacter sp.]|uniref:rod-binding protein n=1 Tax=Emcibacter sp. TaxID=1979954 RepID=UPI002AA7E46C|nr:rod-binding protein [Emcibacter sp.]
MEPNIFTLPSKTTIRQPVEAPKTAAQKAARATAEEFEAVFLADILKNMSVGLDTDGPFGGGHAEEMYKGLLNEQIANSISRNGGIGLSDAVYREILKTQEAGQ